MNVIKQQGNGAGAAAKA